MPDELQVIAQCQRCGRGFIMLADNVRKDAYLFPDRIGLRDRRVCNGAIKRLAQPAPISQFNNYGPLLAIRQQDKQP